VSEDGGPTIWCKANLDDVTQGMQETDYPANRIEYVAGRVEETIPSQVPQTISILRVDTDWYSSTLHILNHLYERVSPGGVLIFDDYDSWEGARTAVDEFRANLNQNFLLIRLDKGRVMVKNPE